MLKKVFFINMISNALNKPLLGQRPDATVYVWFLGQIYKSRRISTVASAPAAERIYFNAEIQIIVGAVWEL